jgi:hypothetical protein
MFFSRSVYRRTFTVNFLNNYFSLSPGLRLKLEESDLRFAASHHAYANAAALRYRFANAIACRFFATSALELEALYTSG